MSAKKPVAAGPIKREVAWPTLRTYTATAYHEAGHAVAAFVLGVPLKSVCIVPDPKAGNAGHVSLGRCRSVDAMHKLGIVAVAGEAAQRRYNPRSVRRHHGGGDRQAVVDFALDRTGGSEEQATLLARLWELQARDLVESRWDAVQLVAKALFKRNTLDAAQIRMILFRIPGAEDAHDRRL